MARKQRRYSKIAQLLLELIDRGVVTIEELAWRDCLNCSGRQVYKYANGEAWMEDYEVEDLLRYLSSRDIHFVHSATMSPRVTIVERYFGQANGTTKDDFVKAVKAASGADDAFDDNDKPLVREFIDALIGAVADFEAEYELLK